MSYNGVGLSTPRGSGTNGHITRNLSTVRHHDTFKKPAGFSEGERRRAPDAGILEHDRKRRVEVKCLELEVELQDDGVGEEEVERQVSALRARLLAESAAGRGSRDSGSIKMHETHELGRANDLANERMRKAMGIRTEDYVEGKAFDREALAADKVKKAEQRELDNIERARIQAQLKIDREKANVEREAQRARDDIERQKRRVEDAQRAKVDAEDREQSRARRVQDDMRQLDSELDQGQAPHSSPLEVASPREPKPAITHSPHAPPSPLPLSLSLSLSRPATQQHPTRQVAHAFNLALSQLQESQQELLEVRQQKQEPTEEEGQKGQSQ